MKVEATSQGVPVASRSWKRQRNDCPLEPQEGAWPRPHPYLNPVGVILYLGILGRKTEGKRRRGQQRMRWLDSMTNSVDTNLSKLQEMLKDRGR